MPDETPAPETPPPAPAQAPSQSAPAAPAPTILASDVLGQPAWKARKFRDNWALARGGDVDIVRNASGQLAAFVPDPSKLTDAGRAEIAKILDEPRYKSTAPANS